MCGPLQRSHDLSVVETRTPQISSTGRLSYFNEATTFRSWRHSSAEQAWIPRPHFNEATTFRSWRPEFPQPQLPYADLHFNEATTFRSWRHAESTIPQEERLHFNEATTFRSWRHYEEAYRKSPKMILQRSHDLSVVETPSVGRSGGGRRSDFNEATTFRSWRHVTPLCPLSTTLLSLQRSHDLSVVETCLTDSSIARVRSLQRSHDLSVVETRIGKQIEFHREQDFNEATTFRSWRREGLDALPGNDDPTSTKPRPFGRGDSATMRKKYVTVPDFNEATTFRSWRPQALALEGG